MNLFLQRSQRSSFRHRIIYILDVTIATTLEERTLIQDHRLGDNTLYAVPDIEANHTRAETAFSRSDNRSLLHTAEAPRLLTDLAAAVFHSARARLGYVIKVNDALAGTRVLCPDLFQQLDVENALIAAFDELDRNVQNALAFTIGREQVFVPDTQEETTDTPPAHWANHHRWGGNI